jgi:hypothetical protein
MSGEAGGLTRNVGGIDRIARAVLAVVLAAIGIWAILGEQWTMGVLALVAAGGFAFNAATQFCGVNALLGIDTCSWDGQSETGE